MKKWIGGLISVLFFSSLWAQELYPFDNPKQTAQFQHLLSDLRCLVCQNQDLSDSHAEFAEDLRREVYERVTSGQSDDEIINYLTSRFGDYILFKPPVKSMTWFLWGAPLLFLILGLGIFGKAVRHAK
jgi:cytochrome c-type biogenesis protein CcmH